MIKKIPYIASFVLFLIMGCKQLDQQSVFLIPDGYHGPVMIVFDQENGAKREYAAGKRVYRVPENGILETQFKSNLSDPQSLTFYYVTKDKKRIPIEYLTQSQLENGKKIKRGTYVFSAWSGSSGHTNDDLYKFETFLVGKVSERDSLLNERMSMTFEYQKQGN